MAKNDGGAAFPTVEEAFGGMSLRDYFAAAAMQGWLASFPDDAVIETGNESGIATLAYRIAAAMLKEREEEHG